MEKISYFNEPERVETILRAYDCFFHTNVNREAVISALKDNKSFTNVEIIVTEGDSPIDWRFFDTYRRLPISDQYRLFSGWTNWQNDGGDSVYTDAERKEIETLR